MGTVAISIKITPESPEVDIENIKKKILSDMVVKDLKIEPIAFGLKAIKILIVKNDTGGTDDVEEKIRGIDGVGSVEVESVTLL
ncbi:MAG: elongation factor 1-beta [Candidatus Aenigmarchaeota archaeon]|nr:elongation factor 1-beta [Candidatus Aenigmarchaeota archaeon]